MKGTINTQDVEKHWALNYFPGNATEKGNRIVLREESNVVLTKESLSSLVSVKFILEDRIPEIKFRYFDYDPLVGQDESDYSGTSAELYHSQNRLVGILPHYLEHSGADYQGRYARVSECWYELFDVVSGQVIFNRPKERYYKVDAINLNERDKLYWLESGNLNGWKKTEEYGKLTEKFCGSKMGYGTLHEYSFDTGNHKSKRLFELDFVDEGKKNARMLNAAKKKGEKEYNEAWNNQLCYPLGYYKKALENNRLKYEHFLKESNFDARGFYFTKDNHRMPMKKACISEELAQVLLGCKKY